MCIIYPHHPFNSDVLRMSHRVNVVLDNYAWEALQSVPKGELSQINNTAMHREL